MNKVILTGRVGQSPDTNTTQGGTVISKFTLATSERYKGKDGERKERTEWHNVRTWNKTAEFVDKYVTKGSQVLIEGRIRYETYDGKDGSKRYVTIIDAENIELLGTKQNGDGKNNEPKDRNQEAAPADNDDSLDEQPDDLPF